MDLVDFLRIDVLSVDRCEWNMRRYLDKIINLVREYTLSIITPVIFLAIFYYPLYDQTKRYESVMQFIIAALATFIGVFISMHLIKKHDEDIDKNQKRFIQKQAIKLILHELSGNLQLCSILLEGLQIIDPSPKNITDCHGLIQDLSNKFR